jgi:hypothetical protein
METGNNTATGNVKGYRMIDFSNDIDGITAQRAFEGTSFSSKTRGKSYIASYIEEMEAAYKLLKDNCNPDHYALLESEFNRFHKKMKSLNNEYLSKRSRCMSTMITGGSNFPTRSNSKKYDYADSAMSSMYEYKKKALAAISKKLHPELRPIMSGDLDAVKRLELKITEAESLQAYMKNVNKIIRSKPKYELTTDKLEKLTKLGMSEVLANKVFEKDCMGSIGFPRYTLTNNNAKISNDKKRLKILKITKEQKDFEVHNEATGITLKDCPSENRIKIFFPGEPEKEVRTELKSHGFRWAPSEDCWKAYRNNNSINYARGFKG